MILSIMQLLVERSIHNQVHLANQEMTITEACTFYAVESGDSTLVVGCMNEGHTIATTDAVEGTVDITPGTVFFIHVEDQAATWMNASPSKCHLVHTNRTGGRFFRWLRGVILGKQGRDFTSDLLNVSTLRSM